MMRLRKHALLWLFGALTLTFLGLSVAASPVTFTAGTTGNFGVGSTSGSVSSDGSALTIGATTIQFSSRSNEINVALSPGGSSNVTLGVFTVTSSALTALKGATFTLNINFSLPGDTAPHPATYHATLNGTIDAGASGASVTWAVTTLTFTSPTVGTFTLTLEAATPINSPLSPEASRIRGTIGYTAGPAPIPEPLTLLTLGSGLVGLAAFVRRRRA